MLFLDACFLACLHPNIGKKPLQKLVQGGFTEDQPILEVDADIANATALAEEVVVGVRDETHPLVTLLETTPHAMSLLIKPWNYHPDTMVRSPNILASNDDSFMMRCCQFFASLSQDLNKCSPV